MNKFNYQQDLKNEINRKSNRMMNNFLLQQERKIQNQSIKIKMKPKLKKKK